MIIDCFTYNGERDILKLRLSILGPHVDKFIICEAKSTFTKHPKPLYFFRDNRFFKKWWKQIEYFIIDDDYTPEEELLARESPNTQGASHWRWEFLQKERIQKALKDVGIQDNDLVYIGDVDEIWEPYAGPYPAKLKLKVYAYYLDNRSSEEFWGTYVAPYSYFKNKTLNHERSRIDISTPRFHGFHFTSMGGLKELQRKLNDSYTTETYNTYAVQENLSERLQKGIDYLGRDFTFKRDESEWPDFLKSNRSLYKHLL